MDAVETLRAYALVGLPVGLATGLAMSLVAKDEDGWGGYASFRRRAARLGHVCAVMLPVIAGVWSAVLASVRHDAALAAMGAALWVGGGVALALALFATARRPGLRLLLPLPALLVVAGSCLFAASWLPYARS